MSEKTNYLVQYVRKDDKLVGCVVAVKSRNGEVKLGWSLCHKLDRFSKREAKLQALKKLGEKPAYSVLKEYQEMVHRADKYYKPDSSKKDNNIGFYGQLVNYYDYLVIFKNRKNSEKYRCKFVQIDSYKYILCSIDGDTINRWSEKVLKNSSLNSVVEFVNRVRGSYDVDIFYQGELVYKTY